MAERKRNEREPGENKITFEILASHAAWLTYALRLAVASAPLLHHDNLVRLAKEIIDQMPLTLAGK